MGQFDLIFSFKWEKRAVGRVLIEMIYKSHSTRHDADAINGIINSFVINLSFYVINDTSERDYLRRFLRDVQNLTRILRRVP